MNCNSLISVIIVTYKRSHSFIKRAIESVLIQSYINIEIIIIDANKDSDYSKQIQYYINLINKDNVQFISLPGISNNHARNAGFKVSKGDYIAFMDDDDEWNSNKLEKQLELFVDDTSLVYSNYIVSDQYNDENPFFKEIPDADNLKIKIFGENIMGCTSMPVMTRQVFIDVGGFNESFKANQDWDLWIRMLQDHKAKYSPIIAGTKHYSRDSISNKKFRRLAGWISLFIHHAPKYRKNKEQLGKALEFFIGEMFDKKMYLIGMTALPLYAILKNKENKK